MDNENTKNATLSTDYPQRKVINLYAQFGGALVGFIIWLISMVPEIRLENNQNIFSELINISMSLGLTLMISVVVGFIFGLIPSLFAGWIIAQIKVYRNGKGLLTIFVIGGFISMAFLASSETLLIVKAMIGGISALIIGVFALPKPIIDNNINSE